MSIFKKIVSNQESISIVGLGYVGMPLAVAFARKNLSVIGFDLNNSKIELYKSGIDPTKEVGDETIKTTTVQFTSNEKDLQKAKFHIVAVPTPINSDHTPDLTPIISASEILGRNLCKGSIIVYESTVYPGCTENVCIPILEKESGMKCGIDFKIGYSPERINPGDTVHRLENIVKIVSGMDEESLEEIKKVYDLVIEVGTYPVSNIRTAEAIKVVENSQRDVNIAFMNELAMVFDRMGIDTNEVVDGMNTKWNALGFRPGLVGGHCIGVDPYYLTYKAQSIGYHPEVILAGRRINDNMGKYVATSLIKQMILKNIPIQGSIVTVLGITFKENVPDIRNSKVVDIISELKDFGVRVQVSDVLADKEEVEKEYGLQLVPEDKLQPADAVVVAVPHQDYRKRGWNFIKNLLKQQGVVVDIKSVLDKKACPENITLWRL